MDTNHDTTTKRYTLVNGTTVAHTFCLDPDGRPYRISECSGRRLFHRHLDVPLMRMCAKCRRRVDRWASIGVSFVEVPWQPSWDEWLAAEWKREHPARAEAHVTRVDNRGARRDAEVARHLQAIDELCVDLDSDDWKDIDDVGSEYCDTIADVFVRLGVQGALARRDSQAARAERMEPQRRRQIQTRARAEQAMSGLDADALERWAAL